MHAYSLTIGARTAGGAASFRAGEDRLLRRITRLHFPAGFTILKARGGWWNSARGKFEEEESREIRVTARTLRPVRAWALALGRALRQKELLVIGLGRAHRIRTSR